MQFVVLINESLISESLIEFINNYIYSDIAECASNPCQNNAPCLDQLNGYLCLCNNTGFFGVHCQIG